MKEVLSGIGTLMFLLGLGGVGGYCEGHGSLTISLIFFILGYVIAFIGFRKEGA